MFTERQLEKYADVLEWGLQTARADAFEKEDIVMIRFHKPAIRLAEILFERIIKKGWNPVFRILSTPAMEKGFYKNGTDPQLTFITPGEEELYQNINGNILLFAPESITHLSDIDPGKIAEHMKSRKFLKDILDKREEKGEFGWTLCALPTEEQARQAGISLEEYTAQIARACFLDEDDPAAKWEEVFRSAQSVKEELNRLNVKYFHVESENTDLKVFPGENRKWIGISGHNIPSFELFLSPDWRETEGVYYADQPSYKSGNYVKSVRLVFKEGEVVESSAEQGESFLKKQLEIDEGASRVGEFSLTDRRFSRIDRFMANTLFDENFGGEFGNCHVAIGSSYSDTYGGDISELTEDRKKDLGFNDSALHWDLVNTEQKRVTAYLVSGDKKVIYENGEFQV
jgi:aminopeptidase